MYARACVVVRPSPTSSSLVFSIGAHCPRAISGDPHTLPHDRRRVPKLAKLETPPRQPAFLPVTTGRPGETNAGGLATVRELGGGDMRSNKV
ncbi:hypothetical protein BSKO_00169 [Bryopsis sp. KO-2023]|nr:hypothetical protein BSKO_00169 [Bryopsis sp. KO-2023]